MNSLAEGVWIGYDDTNLKGLIMDRAHEDASHEVEEKHAGEANEIKLDSVTLARLLAEVRNEDLIQAHAYNRQHNRHNR